MLYARKRERMKQKRLGHWKRIKSNWTLRARLWCVLLINSFIILLMVKVVSDNYVREVNEIKLRNEIKSSLDGISYELNSVFDELSGVVLQLALNEEICDKISAAYDFHQWGNKHDSDEIINYTLAKGELRKELDYAIGLNSKVEMIVCYAEEEENTVIVSAGTTAFGSDEAMELQDIDVERGMAETLIHRSMRGNYRIISSKRKILPGEYDNIYIYAEIKNGYLQELLKMNRYEENSVFVILDDSEKVVYSENESLFSPGTLIDFGESEWMVSVDDAYYIFRTEGEKCTVVELVDKQQYDSYLKKWDFRFWRYGGLVFIIATFFAMFTWKMLYDPIKILKREFRKVSENPNRHLEERTNIKEFDELLTEFWYAKEAVVSLEEEMRQKERRQKELEIEKLLLQINPHFMYNTLNCVQWMARLKGEKEIEKLLIHFIRIIGYNLGKKDIYVKLSEEISIIGNYIELQKIKSRLELELLIHVEKKLEEVIVPRFILQPIIENAIFHGLNSNGKLHIDVSVKAVDDDFFLMQVTDDGKGMTQEQVERAMDFGNSRKESGKGIGLRYVNDMIHFYCGQDSDLCIESKPGEGTVISLVMPIRYSEV